MTKKFYSEEQIIKMKEACNCSKCEKSCIHKDAFRRLPRELGGSALCSNLNSNIKL